MHPFPRWRVRCAGELQVPCCTPTPSTSLAGVARWPRARHGRISAHKFGGPRHRRWAFAGPSALEPLIYGGPQGTGAPCRHSQRCRHSWHGCCPRGWWSTRGWMLATRARRLRDRLRTGVAAFGAHGQHPGRTNCRATATSSVDGVESEALLVLLDGYGSLPPPDRHVPAAQWSPAMSRSPWVTRPRGARSPTADARAYHLGPRGRPCPSGLSRPPLLASVAQSMPSHGNGRLTLRVLVAMSGGVDSSVAVRLMLGEGHE